MEQKRLVSRSAAKTAGRTGRPRSQASHDAILTAAIALTREVGYDALTIDGIAVRAGVGKATVYRRWSSKETLIAEALHRLVRSIPEPDTGSVRGDLLVLMRGTLAMYHDPATKGLLSGLVAAMARSTVIGDAVRSGFVAARTEAVRHALQRGVARGELRKGTRFELALDLLHGPLFYRFLISDAPLDERLVRNLIDVVLREFARP